MAGQHTVAAIRRVKYNMAYRDLPTGPERRTQSTKMCIHCTLFRCLCTAAWTACRETNLLQRSSQSLSAAEEVLGYFRLLRHTSGVNPCAITSLRYVRRPSSPICRLWPLKLKADVFHALHAIHRHANRPTTQASVLPETKFLSPL